MRAFPAGTSLTGAFCLFSLAACGFQPLYGDNQGRGAVDRSLSQVRVEQIGDRLGVIMTNSLRDAFNPDAIGVVPRYVLTVSLNETASDETIRSDSTASRTALILTVYWALKPAGAGKPIDSGSLTSSAGFDILESNDYANVTSKRTEEERLVQTLSQEIELRVAAALRKVS